MLVVQGSAQRGIRGVRTEGLLDDPVDGLDDVRVGVSDIDTKDSRGALHTVEDLVFLILKSG